MPRLIKDTGSVTGDWFYIANPGSYWVISEFPSGVTGTVTYQFNANTADSRENLDLTDVDGSVISDVDDSVMRLLKLAPGHYRATSATVAGGDVIAEIKYAGL